MPDPRNADDRFGHNEPLSCPTPGCPGNRDHLFPCEMLIEQKTGL